MNVVLWIVFGAIAGFIASAIMKTNDGILWDIILGIAGAVLGGFLMNSLGNSGITGFNLYSFVVAILGAVVLIYLSRLIRRSSAV